MSVTHAFRAVATSLAVLFLVQACASRAPYPTPTPPVTAIETMPAQPIILSGDLAVGVDARIEDGLHEGAPKILAVRITAENRGARPVILRRKLIVLAQPDGMDRNPDHPNWLAYPQPGRGQPAPPMSGANLAYVHPVLGLVFLPLVAVMALGAVSHRERQPEDARVAEYIAQLFPWEATLGPSESVSGFVYFSLGTGDRDAAPAALRVLIEDAADIDEAEIVSAEGLTLRSPRVVRVRLLPSPGDVSPSSKHP